MSAVMETHEPSANYLSTLQLPLVQHFELMATAPGGVAKLRELILTLAVQGKLMPQDPSDEPASELLKQVRAEKARLIAEGKIKREKPSSEITEEEQPFRLPNGWAWVRIAEIAYPQAGFAFKSSGFNEVRQGLPLIRIRDVGGNDPTTFFAGEYREEFVVESGDWLISMDGEFRVREWRGPRALLNQRVTRLVFFGRTLFQPFITAALQFELSELQGTKAYTTVDHLSGGQIASSVIAIPPLAEQARIVTRVEELMRLCDALEAKGQLEAAQHGQLVQTLLGTLTASISPEELADNWQRVATHFDLLLDRPEAIDALEQTILQLAVRGLLVPQDPKDEPASELLKKIRAEKDGLIAEGKIKRDKLLPPANEDEKPFAVPSTWQWVRLGQIADSRLGKMLDKAKNSGKRYPYLRNTNVQWHHIDLSDIKEIALEDFELEEFRLHQGDLLICEGGYPGRCAIWNESNKEMYFQKALHRVRPFGGIPPEFLAFSLEADSRSGMLEKYFTGATIKHFVGQALESYLVPLPPSAELPRIVARVQSLRRLCADLRQRLAVRQTTQAHLAAALIDEVA